MHIHVAI